MHPEGLSPPFTFITREGLTPKHSHKCSTPWSVFQDGSLMTITPASLQCANLGPRQGIMQQAITLPGGSHIPEAFIPRQKPMLASTRGSAPVRTPDDPPRKSLVINPSLSTISRAI